MRIAVFVENRNGVGLASESMKAPGVALGALRQVLDEEVSEEEYRDAEELFDISAFTTRMTAALNLAGPDDVRRAVSADGGADTQGPDGETPYDEGAFLAVLSRPEG